MITPITYPTSLDYWMRCADPTEYKVSYMDVANSEYFRSCTVKDILRDANIFHLSQPYHVYFPNANLRHMAEGFICHILPKNLPPESFVKLTNNLYIICPELTFLLAGAELSVPALVNLGCNLCSIYKRDDFSPTGQLSRKQITTVQSITDYLDGLHGIHGLANARLAARHILDNSNSPMESNLATLFRLPLSMGGGGIKNIELNACIKLHSRAAEVLKYDECMVDIKIIDQLKVIEYDSNLTHLDPRQHARDKRRQTALQMSGYDVYTITAEDIKSHVDIDKMILSVRNFLGMRTHMDRFMKYRIKRWVVIDELFFNNANHKR